VVTVKNLEKSLETAMFRPNPRAGYQPDIMSSNPLLFPLFICALRKKKKRKTATLIGVRFVFPG